MRTLTTTEQAEQAKDEGIVEAGIASYIEVGEALLRIKNRLAMTSEQFHDYCMKRFMIGRKRGEQIIRASKIGREMEGLDKNLSKESHATALAKIPATLRGPALQAASAEGPVTAARLNDIASRCKVFAGQSEEQMRAAIAESEREAKARAEKKRANPQVSKRHGKDRREHVVYHLKKAAELGKGLVDVADDLLAIIAKAIEIAEGSQE